jgi:hypothetical protein
MAHVVPAEQVIFSNGTPQVMGAVVDATVAGNATLKLPAKKDTVILGVKVVMLTAFDGNGTIKVGTSDDDDRFITDGMLTETGAGNFGSSDDQTGAGDAYVAASGKGYLFTADGNVEVLFTKGSTTTGKALVLVSYIHFSQLSINV